MTPTARDLKRGLSRLRLICRWHPTGEVDSKLPIDGTIPAKFKAEIQRLSQELRAWEEAKEEAEFSSYFQYATGEAFHPVDPPPPPAPRVEGIVEWALENWESLELPMSKLMRHVYGADRIKDALNQHSMTWKILRDANSA